MKMIATPSPTMTSDELLELINEARTEAGESALRRNKLAEKIEDELAGEHYTKRVVQNSNSTESAVFDLTRDQCMLVAMRESKSVRRRVVDKINDLEARQRIRAPAELSRIEILQIAIESEQARLQAESERDHAVATKAQIGQKREATAMATASAAVREARRLKDELGRGCSQATVTAVELATGRSLPKNAYVPLRTWCKEHNARAAVVPDSRFGKVKAWPAGAWLDVYGIDLSSLFAPEEVAP